jgi:predicted ABC-type ATPase
VANRVQQGGDSVPEADVRRRFASRLRILFPLYRPQVDPWWLLDAHRQPPVLIAREEDGVFTAVQADLFDHFQRQIEE